MPKINIREIDNTGLEAQEFTEYLVLIPGIGLPKTELDAEGNEVLVEGKYVDSYFETADALKNKFDKVSKFVPNYTDDLGYKIAYYILQAGLPIQYVSAYTDAEDAEAIALDKSKLDEIYKEYEDRGKYDVRFITLGGIPSNPTTIQTILECAGNRGDAVAVCSVPQKGEISVKNEKGETIKTEVKDLVKSDVIDTWVQQNLSTICNLPIPRKGVSWNTSRTETYGSYGAIFASDFIGDILVNGKQVKNMVIPAWVGYLACFAKYTQRFNDWYAMSGSIRGVLPLTITPKIVFGDTDTDIFQVRTEDPSTEAEEKYHVSVNPIARVRPYGDIIWGNRTMHPLQAPLNGSSAAIQLTASSFLNIRNLCIDIKKTLYRAARRYTFEPNSDVLWINFKAAITPLLNKMTSDNGIRGYQIIKTPTNKKALLAARIVITPIEAVEDFDLTIELNDSIEVQE